MLSTTQEANEYRKNFDKYYQEMILPTLLSFEQIRKGKFLKYRLYCLLMVLCIIFPILITAYLVIHVANNEILQMPEGLIIVAAIFISVCFVFLQSASQTKKGFEKEVKETAINPFLSFFGNFKWSQGKYLDLKEIRESKLIGSFDELVPDDYFEGEFREKKFIISEIKLLKRGDKDSRAVMFNGIFIKIPSNKTISSHTIIKEDVSLNKIIFNYPNRFPNLAKTEFEDVEFNKMFDIYTDDDVEARYLITTTFIERFKRLQEIFNAREIRASFKDNSILIAISCKKDMFVLGDIRKPITDSTQIQTLFEEFLAVMSIVEVLNLDSKTGL